MHQDVVKKIKHLEIRTRKVVNSTFAGGYHSVFKGQGISFSEIREYQPGDDIRLIDWNVTAKTGTPYIKIFDEERELSVMLLVDISASGCFGSAEQNKRDVAIEIAAVLGFSAAKNQDRVGMILCSDQVEQFVPPKRGRDHMLRLIRDLYCITPKHKGTYLASGIDYLLRMHKRKTIVFVLSDFWDERSHKSFQIASRHHEIVPIIITDPREHTLPSAGLLWLEDAETGDMFPIDSSSPKIREQYQLKTTMRNRERDQFFKRNRITPIHIDITKPYIGPLRSYFEARGHAHA
jgi:uncharacterized protein (DUF58 family)